MSVNKEDDGRIVSINGSIVQVKGLSSYRMGEITYVGEERLIGEVIVIEQDIATIQVYEPVEGLRINDPIYPTNKSLTAELGPGLLSNIFDGIQRPLERIKQISESDFIKRGIRTNSLDRQKKWQFKPNKEIEKGDIIRGGDILGEVQETETIISKILSPPGFSGELIELQEKGDYTVTEPILISKNNDGEKKELSLMHEWPVRIARPFSTKLPVSEPLITGQRIIDMFFPIAKGGTAAIPGGFGTGKCVDGRTPVLLSNGQKIPIEQLFIENYTDNSVISKDSEYETLIDVREKNMQVLSFDKDSAKIVNKKVSHIYRGSSGTMVKITTKKGRHVTITPIHKLQIFDGEKIIEKMAQDIVIGEYLVCPRKLELVRKDKVNIDLSKITCNLRITNKNDIEKVCEALDFIRDKHNKTLKDIAKELNINYDVLTNINLRRSSPSYEIVKRLLDKYQLELNFDEFKSERRSKTIKLPTEVSIELAEFLGLILSDGRIQLDRVTNFYNNDDFLRNRFQDLARSLFLITGKEFISNEVKAIQIFSKPLASFLVSLGLPLVKKSRNAFIPQEIMESNDETLIHFLNAYIAGDGYVDGCTLEISTASSKMSSDLSYLLSRLGIIYRISEKQTMGHVYYRIAIEGFQLKKLGHLMELCKVTSFIKTNKILDYSNKKISHFESSNSIPIKQEILIRNHKNILETEFSYERKKSLETIKNVKRGRKVTENTLRNFVNFLTQIEGEESNLIDKTIDNLDYILDINEQFYFDSIRIIEFIDESQEVFDITVEDTHNFIGGDSPIILHNTVIQHQMAKWSNANVVVYIGCGERGNEMTDVLREFPKLIDPYTDNPLMARTILVANVSNMPVAAREASIYMGITMAEYYRDQGYAVLLTADSTSRWAEALREISGQLAELPVEEGFPAYLGARLANFYERAGKVIPIGSPYREGSINITAAVSPPGGDFSEPVTANTKRFVKTFWGLDSTLANRKHFPAINWLTSYSGYISEIEEWALESGLEDWGRYRQETMKLLLKDEELQHIVELIGSKALPSDEQLIILIADIIKSGILQQSAFHPIDTFCPIDKQMKMMKLILLFHQRADILIKNGCPISLITSLKSVQFLKRMKEDVGNDDLIQFNKIEDYIHSEMEDVGSKCGYRI